MRTECSEEYSDLKEMKWREAGEDYKMKGFNPVRFTKYY
jgi:hypothetical protein